MSVGMQSAAAGYCVRIGAVVKCSDGSQATRLGDISVVQVPAPEPEYWAPSVPEYSVPAFQPIAPVAPVGAPQIPAIGWGRGMR
jgi:hypothetical protein